MQQYATSISLRGNYYYLTRLGTVTKHTDTKVQNRKCLYTLHGHLDYVRSCQFHHEMPWIVSLKSRREYTALAQTVYKREGGSVLINMILAISTSFRHLMIRPFASGLSLQDSASPFSPGTITTSCVHNSIQKTTLSCLLQWTRQSVFGISQVGQFSPATAVNNVLQAQRLTERAS